MDKLPSLETQNGLGNMILTEKAKTKAFYKNFLNNAGIFLSVFLTLAIMVISNMDISIASFQDISSLSAEGILVLIGTYAVYISCNDTGARHGMITQIYKATVERYETLKTNTINTISDDVLYGFCEEYATKELENTRRLILSSTGLTYDKYVSEWLGKSRKTVNESDLTNIQKKAVNEANHLKALPLTPSMLIKKDTKIDRMNPLGMSPQSKRNIGFAKKFVLTLLTSALIPVVIFKIQSDSLFVIISECCIILINILINGYSGYMSGYKNIIIDSVSYMDNQSDLLVKVSQYNASKKG